MDAHQSWDKKMVRLVFQLGSMGDQQLHWKATVFEIDDFLLLPYAI
jgi:hypothetical protein